jgi:class 3 adenylate cyclase
MLSTPSGKLSEERDVTYGLRPENWITFRAELDARGITANEIERVEIRPVIADSMPLGTVNVTVTLRSGRVEAWTQHQAESEITPAWAVAANRILTTVLFIDIVSATKTAAALGDQRWRDVLQRYRALVRRELARYHGREIEASGDGFLTTFDGPTRAIRCAFAVRDAVGLLDLDVRAGVHTGECEVMDDKIGGIAVHIGARVAAGAAPGEILVSGTVKDLVIGSPFQFTERGIHALKGVPGEWRLYAAAP